VDRARVVGGDADVGAGQDASAVGDERVRYERCGDTVEVVRRGRCTGGDTSNGGDYERATDPWVTIGPDAIAYQIALAFNGQTFMAGSSSAILVSRSLDGGRSWSSPVTLIRDAADNFNDKESITADPTTAGFAYAVWDRLSAAGHGPSYFSRTTNGGTAWEAARQIYDPGPTGQTINNQIVVLSDGTLVMFFTQLDDAGGGNATASFGVIRSTDKGLTWSERIIVTGVQAVGARDPENGTFVRDARTWAIAAGPHNDLVVVWQDARFSAASTTTSRSRVPPMAVSRSAPARINRDRTSPRSSPASRVRGDGTIGVTYFDFRSNTPDHATLPTDYWITRSSDGITWRESRVAGPFDLAIAPLSGGLFLGDYQALITIGELFVPFYAATNTGDLANRTDIFASLVSSAGAAAASAQTLRATESFMRAQTASPLAATRELARRLSGSIARTMLRRVPGWTASWLDRASAQIP
jgi:hypothetical protein